MLSWFFHPSAVIALKCRIKFEKFQSYLDVRNHQGKMQLDNCIKNKGHKEFGRLPALKTDNLNSIYLVLVFRRKVPRGIMLKSMDECATLLALKLALY